MTPPYTPVRAAGDWRIVSGQIGLTATGMAEDFAGQLRDVLANLDAQLQANGIHRDQVAKTLVFLVDMADYDELNAIYTEFFDEPRPARSAIGVASLPLGALVEIEAWAYVG